MKLIEQSWEWIQKPLLPLELIEKAGRTCYQSQDKITAGTAAGFVQKLLRSGHESVLEHVSVSIKLITNRGVMAELTRHRLCSFSIESTRYVKYEDGLECIKPVWWNDWDETQQSIFRQGLYDAEDVYKGLIYHGASPQQAREVLPNALKTDIVMTANLREWRHIFRLRTSKKAHPQMRALMFDVLQGFKKEIPIIFDNICNTEKLDQRRNFGE